MTIKARIADYDNKSDRRGSERRTVDLEARVRELGSEGSEARIVNLSETGFMAEVDCHYEVGTRVWLILPGRDRASALIRWVAGNRIGAQFAEPLDLAGLDL